MWIKRAACWIGAVMIMPVCLVLIVFVAGSVDSTMPESRREGTDRGVSLGAGFVREGGMPIPKCGRRPGSTEILSRQARIGWPLLGSEHTAGPLVQALHLRPQRRHTRGALTRTKRGAQSVHFESEAGRACSKTFLRASRVLPSARHFHVCRYGVFRLPVPSEAFEGN
jgi:hypothetical protein